ncbi:hypothetical protein J2S74_003911 [Evansella vedderi]|uniref:Replication initiation factor n=1 Tax=Evansella vedderi TaxID=38282 RepID=A0ABT9ZZ18_9BACI|nr:hypothetical protein [Evansella vedderi]MDQ0256491.1 hypothetical protein [Evansella vedderi]
MLSLEYLQECYGFNHSKWKINGEILDTEKGVKRLTNWTEEKRVRWHVQWRDQLAEKTGCLTNRMIQTIHGERIILSDAGWVTLHDEVTSLFSYKNRENEIGAFFGRYFSLGMQDVDTEINDPYANNKLKIYLQQSFLTKNSTEEMRFLEGIRRESRLRYNKAKEIKEKAGGKQEPIVAPIRSLDQGKVVYGQFYWTNLKGRPEKGYGSLRNVLTEWLQRYGQTSLFSLLNEIDKEFSLKGYHGKNLLAECLTPWEFLEYVMKTRDVHEKDELLVWKEKLTYQWEASRLLVKALGEWLDVAQEKVTV